MEEMGADISSIRIGDKYTPVQASFLGTRR